MEKSDFKKDYHINVFAMRIGFIPEDVNVWYNKKLQKYYLNNSTESRYTTPPDKNDHHFYEYDEYGNFANVEFNRKTIHGILLTEKDFIDIELKRINKYLPHTWRADDRVFLNFYKEFLEQRLILVNNDINSNPFEGNGLNIFLEWKSKCNDTDVHKYSFIYYKLANKGLLHYSRINFEKWLIDNNFIEPTTKLESEKNTTNNNRLDLFESLTTT